MEKDVSIAVITGVASLGGVAIGGLLAWLIARSTGKLQKQIAEENTRSQERTAIDGLVVKMLEIWIAYPHLEKQDFTGGYPSLVGNPHAKERYEAYCIFVFNLLARAFKHFGSDAAKFQDYIGAEEIVETHNAWWHHDKKNFGYDEPFRRCIQSVVDQLRKDGKIQ